MKLIILILLCFSFGSKGQNYIGDTTGVAGSYQAKASFYNYYTGLTIAQDSTFHVPGSMKFTSGNLYIYDGSQWLKLQYK